MDVTHNKHQMVQLKVAGLSKHSSFLKLWKFGTSVQWNILDVTQQLSAKPA